MGRKKGGKVRSVIKDNPGVVRYQPVRVSANQLLRGGGHRKWLNAVAAAARRDGRRCAVVSLVANCVAIKFPQHVRFANIDGDLESITESQDTAASSFFQNVQGVLDGLLCTGESYSERGRQLPNEVKEFIRGLKRSVSQIRSAETWGGVDDFGCVAKQAYCNLLGAEAIRHVQANLPRRLKGYFMNQVYRYVSDEDEGDTIDLLWRTVIDATVVQELEDGVLGFVIGSPSDRDRVCATLEWFVSQLNSARAQAYGECSGGRMERQEEEQGNGPLTNVAWHECLLAQDKVPSMTFNNLLYKAPHVLLPIAKELLKKIEEIQDESDADTKYLPKVFHLLPRRRIRQAFVPIDFTRLTAGKYLELFQNQSNHHASFRLRESSRRCWWNKKAKNGYTHHEICEIRRIVAGNQFVLHRVPGFRKVNHQPRLQQKQVVAQRREVNAQDVQLGSVSTTGPASASAPAPTRLVLQKGYRKRAAGFVSNGVSTVIRGVSDNTLDPAVEGLHGLRDDKYTNVPPVSLLTPTRIQSSNRPGVFQLARDGINKNMSSFDLDKKDLSVVDLGQVKRYQANLYRGVYVRFCRDREINCCMHARGKYKKKYSALPAGSVKNRRSSWRQMNNKNKNLDRNWLQANDVIDESSNARERAANIRELHNYIGSYHKGFVVVLRLFVTESDHTVQILSEHGAKLGELDYLAPRVFLEQRFGGAPYTAKLKCKLLGFYYDLDDRGEHGMRLILREDGLSFSTPAVLMYSRIIETKIAEGLFNAFLLSRPRRFSKRGYARAITAVTQYILGGAIALNPFNVTRDPESYHPIDIMERALSVKLKGFKSGGEAFLEEPIELRKRVYQSVRTLEAWFRRENELRKYRERYNEFYYYQSIVGSHLFWKTTKQDITDSAHAQLLKEFKCNKNIVAVLLRREGNTSYFVTCTELHCVKEYVFGKDSKTTGLLMRGDIRPTWAKLKKDENWSVEKDLVPNINLEKKFSHFALLISEFCSHDIGNLEWDEDKSLKRWYLCSKIIGIVRTVWENKKSFIGKVFNKCIKYVILNKEKNKEIAVNVVLSGILKGLHRAWGPSSTVLPLLSDVRRRKLIAQVLCRCLSGKIQIWLDIAPAIIFHSEGDRDSKEANDKWRSESLASNDEWVKAIILAQPDQGLSPVRVLRFDEKDIARCVAKFKKWIQHSAKFVNLVGVEQHLPLPRMPEKGESRDDVKYRCQSGRQARLFSGRSWQRWSDVQRRHTNKNYMRVLQALGKVSSKTADESKILEYMRVYFGVFGQHAAEMERIARARCNLLTKRRIQAKIQKDAHVLLGYSSRSCRKRVCIKDPARNKHITRTTRSKVDCLLIVGDGLWPPSRPLPAMDTKKLIAAAGHLAKVIVLDEFNSTRKCANCEGGVLTHNETLGYRVMKCNNEDCTNADGIDRDLAAGFSLLRPVISFLVGEPREAAYGGSSLRSVWRPG